MNELVFRWNRKVKLESGNCTTRGQKVYALHQPDDGQLHRPWSVDFLTPTLLGKLYNLVMKFFSHKQIMTISKKYFDLL